MKTLACKMCGGQPFFDFDEFVCQGCGFGPPVWINRSSRSSEADAKMACRLIWNHFCARNIRITVRHKVKNSIVDNTIVIYVANEIEIPVVFRAVTGLNSSYIINWSRTEDSEEKKDDNSYY